MIKKTGTVLTVMVLLLNHAAAKDIDSWSMQISGMTHSVNYSDFNDMVTSVNQSLGSDGPARMETIEMTSGLDLEFLFRMNRFQFGFGVGYQMTPDFEYADGEGNFTALIEDYELKHSVHAKVVSLIGTYDILSFSKFTIYGGGGIAYYMTSLSFEQMRYGDLEGNSATSVYTRTTESDLESDEFGLKGLAGFEFRLNSRMSLDFRLNARYASVNGFMGTQQFHQRYVSNANPEGSVRDETYGVYLVRQEPEPGQVEFGPSRDRPLGTAIHEEGRVNLSGFGIQIGFKIRFSE